MRKLPNSLKIYKVIINIKVWKNSENNFCIKKPRAFKELPAGLTHIGGNLYLENSQLKERPANIREIVKSWVINKY